jgi:cytochrome c biogenesis protein CcmG/thiol:disulfide interchange protein DsbE
MKRLAILLIVVLTSLALVAACSQSEKSDAQENTSTSQTETAAKTSQPMAYAFNLETLEGKTVSLEGYRGKIVLVDIWDTWCPPCKAEIPHFIELYDEYNDQGFEILGIAAGRNGEQAVRDFIKEYDINYPNAMGNAEVFQGFGGIRSIPTTFLIDEDGTIYKKYVGYRPKEVFENDIKALLAS